MSARQQLLEVGEALAARAHLDVFPPERISGPGAVPPPLPDHDHAAQMAHAAKAAFEAAALVDVDPAPVLAALEHLAKTLGDDAVAGMAAVDGVRLAADLVVGYRREVAIGAAVQHGYMALRGLLLTLHRDFEAGGTPTSTRIAQRIETGLDAADEAIRRAKNDREDHDGQGE